MNSILTKVFCLTAASLVIGSANVHAAAITDDFSDGTDGAPPNPPNVTGPVWTHLSAAVGSTGQSWDASTGQYRLKAPTNGAVSSGQQLGFVGSFAGGVYTDVYVRADLVEPSNDPTAVAKGYLTGVAAHLGGSFVVPGGLTGYLFAYNQALAPKRIEITKVRAGGSTSVVAATNLAADLDLLNKDYTLELFGDSLNNWTGNVYEIGNPVPIATTSGTDVNSGGVAPFTSGRSGVFGLSASIITGPVDVTFDNFSTDAPEPAAGLLICVGSSLLLLNRRRFRR